jgi:hypothetical protein
MTIAETRNRIRSELISAIPFSRLAAFTAVLLAFFAKFDVAIMVLTI